MTLIERVGHNVNKHRVLKKMTQRELAKVSGVSLSIINWLECGKQDNVTIKTLQKFADAFRCSPLDLLK